MSACIALLGTVLLFAGAGTVRADAGLPVWKDIAPGIEYTVLPLVDKPSVGDGRLHVVRIDPERAEVGAYLQSAAGGRNRTAAEWLAEKNLAVVINAGMYDVDLRTHTGYLRSGGHSNNPRWVKSYRSLLAIGSRQAGAPRTAIIDLDGQDGARVADQYHTAVQNLRLIRGEGINVWAENGRRWSEAAIAQDRGGRLLFLFLRTPLSMREFNDRILVLPLGIVRAMHAEGGPEASLSIHGGGVDLDLSGSYETGFLESDSNSAQWKIPNVIGVRSP